MVVHRVVPFLAIKTPRFILVTNWVVLISRQGPCSESDLVHEFLGRFLL